ncbi:MAG: phosphatidate cytidylyltransferase [Flavobacteriaceae bacterium]|nr:phosphatidate cytidylyltransferase [Flavobacteriaceae bacterium]
MKRLLFGLLYVLLVITATLYSTNFFLILFFIFMNFCIYEFTKIINLKSVYPYILGIISFYYINYLDESINYLEPKNIISVFILLLFYPFIKVLFTKKNILEHLGKVFLTYIYIIIPFSLLLVLPVLLTSQTNVYNTKIILGIFILIWTSDTFAYLVGKQFGKHKLFKRISPKKTIEGFVGSFIFTLIASFILANYFTFLDLKHWLAIATLICIFGSLGDLIESMFKRQANIKDSSNLIPGHGGFLDRLDSFIFAIPFIFIYLILFQ